VRYGAITLFGPSGAPVGTGYLQGVGVAPQVSFSPGQPGLGRGSTFGNAVTVDTSGHYIYSSTAGLALANFSGTPPLLIVASGFTTGYLGSNGSTSQSTGFGQGYTVDGAGNIVYPDGYATPGSGTGATSFSAWDLNPTLPITDPNPTQKQANVYGAAFLSSIPVTRTIAPPANNRAAVDGAGNLFFADDDGNRILEQQFIHGGYNNLIVVATGLNNPGDIAVDAAGAVYVADTGNSRIVKESPNGDGTYTQTVVDSGIAVEGLAIDRVGNLYVSLNSATLQNLPFLLKETLANGSYTRTTLTLQGNLGVDADPAGDVFAVQQGQSINNIQALDVTTPPSLIFAATAVGSTSADSPKTVTVTNNGNAPLNFTGMALSSGYTLAAASTCPALGMATPLAAGASCSFLLNFTPLKSGYDNGTLTLTDNSRGVVGSTQVIPLSGQGAGTGTVAVTLTPAIANYGTVNVGSSSSQGLTLTNSGTATVAVGPTSLSNAVFTLGSSTCGASLAAGANCNFTVVFQPTAVGAQTAVFSVTDDAGTQTAALSGTGAQPLTAEAALTPATANFGTVTVGTTSSAMVFTLANAGNAALSNISFGLSGTGNASFQMGSSTCGSSLSAGGSCNITVTFAPQSAGSISALLSATDAVGTQSATLSGIGVAAAAPQAALTPAVVGFGSVTVGSTASPQTLTLANAGNAPLPVSSVTVTGAGASQFAIVANTCGSNLAAGASCTVRIAFTPASAAAANAILAIQDSVGTQTASLSGSGTNPLPTADFTIAATPASQSAYRGATLTYTVQLNSVSSANPFTSAVALSVTGLPTGATATFSPVSVVPGTGTTATLSVHVPALYAANASQNKSSRLAGMAVASLLLLLLPFRKRQNIRLLLLSFSLVLSGAAVAGCGSGNGFAVPTTQSTLAISGSGNAITHTTSVSLTIK
jgi:hypothetical protein